MPAVNKTNSKLRHASPVNIRARSARIASVNSGQYRPSTGEEKSKINPPNSAKNRATPPTIPTLHFNPLITRERSTSPAKTFHTPIAAKNGTLHCKITSAIDTVRNLSNPGKTTKAPRVNHIAL